MNFQPRLSRRAFLAGSASAGALIVMHPFAALAATNQAHLRLMETTDIHVAIFPYDYYADAPNDTMGLGRTAALINAIRAEATNSVLIDNGDLIQGNPMGDYVAYERGFKDGDVHTTFAAMNTLGYEVSTLGNHEFNYGLDFLGKSLAGANFPLVCANLVNAATITGDDPTKDKTYLPPFKIVEKTITDGDGKPQKIKLGFIGFVPPQIMIWDSANLEGKVAVRDIVKTAEAYVPVMKEQGADLVIALAHTGIDGQQGDMMENAALFLAGVKDIDVVFTGHQHLVFPGPKTWEGNVGYNDGRVAQENQPDPASLHWAFTAMPPATRNNRDNIFVNENDATGIVEPDSQPARNGNAFLKLYRNVTDSGGEPNISVWQD